MEYMYDYIAADDPKAAKKMISRIQEAANKLNELPHMGRAGRVRNTRELVIAATPYIIFIL